MVEILTFTRDPSLIVVSYVTERADNGSVLSYQEFKKILASQEKHNHELQRNSRKNLQNYLFLELNTALIMKSVSLEIEARQLLLNQFKTNKSVRLRD